MSNAMIAWMIMKILDSSGKCIALHGNGFAALHPSLPERPFAHFHLLILPPACRECDCHPNHKCCSKGCEKSLRMTAHDSTRCNIADGCPQRAEYDPIQDFGRVHLNSRAHGTSIIKIVV
jgi:hypothetical protein